MARSAAAGERIAEEDDGVAEGLKGANCGLPAAAQIEFV